MTMLSCAPKTYSDERGQDWALIPLKTIQVRNGAGASLAEPDIGQSDEDMQS